MNREASHSEEGARLGLRIVFPLLRSHLSRQQDRAIVQWAEAVRLNEGKELQIEVRA